MKRSEKKKVVFSILLNLSLIEHHDLWLTCMANTAKAIYFKRKKKLMTKRPPNAFSLPLTGEKKKKKKKVKKYCLTEIQKTLYFIPNKLLAKNLSPNIFRCLSMALVF